MNLIFAALLGLISGSEISIPSDGMFFYADFKQGKYARHYLPVEVGSQDYPMKLYMTT